MAKERERKRETRRERERETLRFQMKTRSSFHMKTRSGASWKAEAMDPVPNELQLHAGANSAGRARKKGRKAEAVDQVPNELQLWIGGANSSSAVRVRKKGRKAEAVDPVHNELQLLAGANSTGRALYKGLKATVLKPIDGVLRLGLPKRAPNGGFENKQRQTTGYVCECIWAEEQTADILTKNAAVKHFRRLTSLMLGCAV